MDFCITILLNKSYHYETFLLLSGIIKAHPMMEGIEDVKTFLKKTQEIVVWEVNGFEQVWNADAHEEYKALLISEFNDWLVVPGDLGWKTPLNDIWERDGLAEGQGRIIITYNNGYTDETMFFREVNEHWGNVDEPEELKEYLTTEVGDIISNKQKLVLYFRWPMPGTIRTTNLGSQTVK